MRIIETTNFTQSDLQPYNDDYVYIPIKPRIHQQHSRKIMDKMIQKYFNKVEQTALNPTRSFGNKWQSLKATYDTYMSLTPNERRRIDVSNMRGYQFDKNTKKLYSFEDNCVYNVTIGDKFNKILVVSKDHLFSDTEKRAVFDNPFQFEPVSPYRITWPSSTIPDIRDLSIVEINNSVDKLSNTMNAFATNMNTVMDTLTSNTSAIINQNAMIYNDFKQQQQQEQEQQEDQEIVYGDRLYYNPDGSYVIDRSKARYVKRGSKAYNTLIDRGWEENGDGTMVHNQFIEKPQPVVQNVIQQQMDIQPLVMQVNNVVASVTNLVDRMTSLDLATNIVDIHSILEEISTVVRGISTRQEEQTQNHLDGYQQTMKSITDLHDKITTRIDEEVPALRELNNAFTNLSSSIMNRENQLDEQIGTLINAQKDVFKKSEDTIAALQDRIDPGNPMEIAEVTPRVDPEVLKGIHSMNSFFEYFKDQYYEYLSNMLQANNALIQSVATQLNQQNEAITIIAGTNYESILQQLQSMNNGIQQSYNYYNPILDNLIQMMQQQSSNTQQLLTDIQRDNRQLLTDIQSDNRNMLGVINQNVVNGNQQRDVQMQMINSLQDQQAYLNWLIQNGFANMSSMAGQLYQSYIALQNRIPQLQLGSNNTIMINDTPVSPLLLTDDNSTIAPRVVDTANTIAPVIESIDKITSENKNIEHINANDVIRDDFISFVNILAKNRDNMFFKQKCQQYGLRLLFNAYRVRNSDDKIFAFFVRLANVVISNEEIEEGFDYISRILANMQSNPDVDQLIGNVIGNVIGN